MLANEEQDKNLKDNLDRIKHKIMVMSGKGGVGKSTVAVNLAYGLLLNGKKVGLLDVDIHGPSIAKMVGIEGQPIVANQNGRIAPIIRHQNLSVISVASFLKSTDDPVIWRGPMKMTVIKQFLSDVEWPELDFLIVDCPPGTGDEPLSVAQTIGKVSGAVIVSTPQDIAYLDVRKSIRFCEDLNMPIIGLIENMVSMKCPHCGEMITMFEGQNAQKVKEDFDVELLGRLDFSHEIIASTDNGEPFVYHKSHSDSGKQMESIVNEVLNRV